MKQTNCRNNFCKGRTQVLPCEFNLRPIRLDARTSRKRKAFLVVAWSRRLFFEECRQPIEKLRRSLSRATDRVVRARRGFQEVACRIQLAGQSARSVADAVGKGGAPFQKSADVVLVGLEPELSSRLSLEVLSLVDDQMGIFRDHASTNGEVG